MDYSYKHTQAQVESADFVEEPQMYIAEIIKRNKTRNHLGQPSLTEYYNNVTGGRSRN